MSKNTKKNRLTKEQKKAKREFMQELKHIEIPANASEKIHGTVASINMEKRVLLVDIKGIDTEFIIPEQAQISVNNKLSAIQAIDPGMLVTITKVLGNISGVELKDAPAEVPAQEQPKKSKAAGILSVTAIGLAIVFGMAMGILIYPLINNTNLVDAVPTQKTLADFSKEEIGAFVLENKEVFVDLFSKAAPVSSAAPTKEQEKPVKKFLTQSEKDAAKHIRLENMRLFSLSYLPEYYDKIPVGTNEYGNSRSGRVLNLITTKSAENEAVFFNFSTPWKEDIEFVLYSDGTVHYYLQKGVGEITIGRAVQLMVDVLRSE